MKITFENDKPFAALLTERFLEAFDFVSQDLLIAKINAFGFNMIALRLIHNYLPNKKLKIRVNLVTNSLGQEWFGVP